MKFNFVSCSVLPLCLLLLGCSAAFSTNRDPNEVAGQLTVSGSSTLAPLVTEIAARFEKQCPGVRIDVQTGGSGKGIADVRTGIADIGMASRALVSDEVDLTAHQIAADGVGLIVHDSNRVNELTADQVIAIYTDKIQRWNEVGGPDQEITVVHKAEGRATLEVFLKHFGIDNLSVKSDVIVGENEHAVKTVAGSKGAIGYVSIGTAEADIELGVSIRLLSLGGIDANTENVASGAYPMGRPLNLVTSDSPSPLVNRFIQFCQSTSVHDLIQSQYFVPIYSETDIAK